MGKQRSLTVWDRELYQYPVIDHNGKEYEKGYIYIYTYIYICIYMYICISESLCCPTETDIIL